MDAPTSPFSVLPEGCIATIISLTSPEDACRAAAVSLGFKSAADSDAVWERFLPHNYREILSRASSPPPSSPKKHLFFLLRRSTLLLDGGNMNFGLAAKTGKNWYTLGARKLQITSIEDPNHWEWISLPESSFAEIAKLRSINRLDIRGVIEARMLSPNTKYVAWLIYRFTMRDDGLDVPSRSSIKFVRGDGTETDGETHTIYLVTPVPQPYGQGRFSWAVEDDWYEIELGEFVTGEGDDHDIHIEVSETERLNEKKGLVVEGIAVRPKDRYKWGYEGLISSGVEVSPTLAALIEFLKSLD